MEPALDTTHQSHLAEFRRRVRGTAFWAAIGGGLMLYFGIGQWIIPTISPLYTTAAHAYIWTLRIGGGTMLAIAALCLTGWSRALIVDAVASGLIAILLAFSGIVFLGNGETNGLLSLVFALMFGGAARQSWNAFVTRPRTTEPNAPEQWTDVARRHETPQPDVNAGHSVAEAIRRRRQGSTPPPARPTQVETVHDDPREIAPPTTKQAPVPPPIDPEPAGGFLAALARDDEARKTE